MGANKRKGKDGPISNRKAKPQWREESRYCCQKGRLLCVSVTHQRRGDGPVVGGEGSLDV